MVIIHQFYEPFLCKKTTFFVLYPILRFFLQKIIVSAWYITQKRFLGILPGADEKTGPPPAKKGSPVFQCAENRRNSYKSYKPDAAGRRQTRRDKRKPRAFQMEKLGVSGGRGWIRTTEALSSRFTVCPHWPLGNTPIFTFVIRRLSCQPTCLFYHSRGALSRSFSTFFFHALLCTSRGRTACLFYHRRQILSTGNFCFFRPGPEIPQNFVWSCLFFFVPL